MCTDIWESFLKGLKRGYLQMNAIQGSSQQGYWIVPLNFCDTKTQAIACLVEECVSPVKQKKAPYLKVDEYPAYSFTRVCP
jgi:hypothetical protein